MAQYREQHRVSLIGVFLHDRSDRAAEQRSSPRTVLQAWGIINPEVGGPPWRGLGLVCGECVAAVSESGLTGVALRVSLQRRARSRASRWISGSVHARVGEVPSWSVVSFHFVISSLLSHRVVRAIAVVQWDSR